MIAPALGYQSQKSSPSPARSFPPSAAPSPDGPRGDRRTAPGKVPTRRARPAAIGEADGVVPDGVTVFNDAFPAVARLDPDLLKALRRAATDAAGERTTFYVNSGWRSPAYQNRLLRDAVSKYGSEEAAARWVATAAKSLHVKGKAVDIGHTDAAKWLSRHGAQYGLCQVYANEPWHYELRADAAGRGCPRMYADPTHDPRTQ
ncbi:M15 family metallopeptidase [Actinomadura sp. NPDC049753]|uniref:M15 family metallopeptidase n=1 Tax=Actinomadura sp. NPDC049753 TaxID=3154739 RepID=UPI00343BAEB3